MNRSPSPTRPRSTCCRDAGALCMDAVMPRLVRAGRRPRAPATIAPPGRRIESAVDRSASTPAASAWVTADSQRFISPRTTPGAGLSSSGANRDRTGDLLPTKRALSQQRRAPTPRRRRAAAGSGIARRDSCMASLLARATARRRHLLIFAGHLHERQDGPGLQRSRPRKGGHQPRHERSLTTTWRGWPVSAGIATATVQRAPRLGRSSRTCAPPRRWPGPQLLRR